MSTTSAVPPSVRRAPASAKSGQRIKDILAVARQVFSESGYALATTTEMARRLGVSEATVFTYFSGKRDLCVRVISDWYDEISAEIEREVPRIAGTREKIEYIVRMHLHHLMVDGTGLCALILSEGRAKNDAFGETIIALQRRYTAPMMKVLAEGQRSGDIRNDMPMSLLRSTIYGPMEHILWDAIHKQTRVNVDATVRDLMQLFWQSLQPPDLEHLALARFHSDVAAAAKRYQTTATKAHPVKPSRKKRLE